MRGRVWWVCEVDEQTGTDPATRKQCNCRVHISFRVLFYVSLTVHVAKGAQRVSPHTTTDRTCELAYSSKNVVDPL